MCILRLSIYNFLKHVSHYLENFLFIFNILMFSQMQFYPISKCIYPFG